jgi:ABC-type nitrate/sulfonate/bicarbonate transport system permease component
MKAVKRATRAAALACAAALLGACGSSTTPTTPTPTQVTDTLTGTVTQNGANTQTFTANAGGTVTATLTDLQPVDTVTIGFSIGTTIGTICQATLANDAATKGFSFTATAATAGTYCVRVYDVGNVTADTPVNYTVTVVHN